MRPAVVAMAAGDDAPPVELAAMVGMKYLFLEQRAAAGRRRTRSRWCSRARGRGWRPGWLTPAPAARRSICRPIRSLAGYVSMREPRQLFQEFTALMMKDERVLRRQPGRGGGETRRGVHREPDRGVRDRGGLRAERVLRDWPDVGDGRPGVQPGGHRQLAPEARGTRQRRACGRRAGQANRLRAGERGRAGLEHHDRPEAFHSA